MTIAITSISQVCGNFVGVRGRKLEAIRSKLGSAGFHLRVNHQLIDSDEASATLYYLQATTSALQSFAHMSGS